MRLPNSSTVGELTLLLTVDGLDITIRGRLLSSGVKFNVGQGDVVRISGKNGSGKTSLLKTLISCAIQSCDKVRMDTTFELGHTVSYIPQDANETLLPWLDSCGNVLLGLAKTNNVRFTNELVTLINNFLDQGETIANPLERLRDYKRNVSTSNLSGGEKQRLAILRGLLCCPQLLILDEPFAELDHHSVSAFVSYLHDFTKRDGAIILVTHQEVDLVYSSEVKL